MIVSFLDPMVTGLLAFVVGFTVGCLAMLAYKANKFSDTGYDRACVYMALITGFITAFAGVYMVTEDISALLFHDIPQSSILVIGPLAGVMITSVLAAIFIRRTRPQQMVAVVMFAVSFTAMSSACSYYGIPSGSWLDMTAIGWGLTGAALLIATPIWVKAYRQYQAMQAAQKIAEQSAIPATPIH